MNVTVILGEEHNEALHRTLGQVLRDLDAEIGPETWVVVGSQDISSWEAVVQGQRLSIESETYMGLSITGEQALVQMIAESVRERTR